MTQPPAGLRQRLRAALTSWFDAAFPDGTQVIIDRMRADTARWSTPEARKARRAAETDARRCYEAAMAQAARPADPARRALLMQRARASLADGDRVMMAVGMLPEMHPRRSLAVAKLQEAERR